MTPDEMAERMERSTYPACDFPEAHEALRRLGKLERVLALDELRTQRRQDGTWTAWTPDHRLLSSQREYYVGGQPSRMAALLALADALEGGDDA